MGPRIPDGLHDAPSGLSSWLFESCRLASVSGELRSTSWLFFDLFDRKAGHRQDVEEWVTPGKEESKGVSSFGAVDCVIRRSSGGTLVFAESMAGRHRLITAASGVSIEKERAESHRRDRVSLHLGRR